MIHLVIGKSPHNAFHIELWIYRFSILIYQGDYFINGFLAAFKKSKLLEHPMQVMRTPLIVLELVLGANAPSVPTPHMGLEFRILSFGIMLKWTLGGKTNFKPSIRFFRYKNSDYLHSYFDKARAIEKKWDQMLDNYQKTHIRFKKAAEKRRAKMKVVSSKPQKPKPRKLIKEGEEGRRMSDEPLRWRPVNDGRGIIGYDWVCECGEVIKFPSGGDVCKCEFVIPYGDQDDWYIEQLRKPLKERDWNRIRGLKK